MANVDGDITLRVDVTPGDVKSAANDIQEELKEIFDQTSGKTLSSEFNNAKASAAKLYESLEAVKNRMAKLENSTVPTTEYTQLSEKLEKLNAQYDKLTEKRKRLEQTGKTKSATYANVEAELQSVYNQAQEIEAAMEAKRLAGQDTMPGVDTAEYKELTGDLNNLTNRASVLQERLNALRVEFNYTAQAEAPVMTYTDLVRQAFSELAGHIWPINEKLGVFVSSLKNVWAIMSAVGSTFKKFGLGVISAIGNLGKFIKSIKNATTHTKRHNTALQMGFKNFIKYGLGVRSVFALLNKMRRALGEGFENLAQYSPEFNSVMSQFVSALETVKNAFATAFAPILSVVIPILDTLMTALINVITLIGKFFAALTGKGIFVQAKRVNKDYAASLNKTAKSAGGASKGIDSAKESAEELKKTIAGFDDVEILHEDKPSSSGGSGGSGGGGGGVGDILPSDMFETVAIDSPIANLANRMRELIANQDWTGLGAFLGEQINIVFAKAKQLISWDNLGERITFIVTAITETFNSLVDTINWDLIGSTLAEGINTIVNTAYLVVTGINWGNFGKKLVEGFNGLVRDVDWRKLGETISEAIKGAIEFVGQGLATVDWAEVGRAIMEFLSGIDWFGLFNELVSNIARILGSIVGGIYELIKESLEESGGDIVGGIFDGILAAIKAFPQWIKENILDPFIEGFNSAFEIESPSKVMKERGRYIIEGLFEGIKEALSAPGKWIKDNIFEPFIKGFESAFQIKNGSNSKSMSKEGRGLVGGLQEGVNERWSSLKTFFTKSASGISDTFKNTDWKGGGSNIVTKLRSGASGMWSTVSSFFSTKTTETRNQFTRYDWKPGGTAIVSGIKAGVQSTWTSIGTYFDTAITGIKNKFNNADWKTPGQNVSNGIKKGIDAGYSSVADSAGDLVWGIKNKFKTSWYDVGYNVCSGISSGIYGGTWKVMNAARDLADDLKSKFGSELKINSPSKVMRDLVGRAIPEGIAAGIEAESGMALKAVSNLSNSIAKQDIPQLQIPAVALGEIIPPEVGKNVDTLNETVKALLDVIKYNQSNTLTREDIMAVLNDVLPSMLQQYVSFYIGDEQIARHANAGNVRLDYRFNPIGR